ncbi:enoyl-CoA hydratase/isomerase family protein [Roseibium sp.]|uniref:enoyl-CoA hydratase/isomerase family protein n=1 Tax=Roseibium sp. TaxID=1936156 RepID=UPI003D0BFC4B
MTPSGAKVETALRDGVFRIWLSRPERHNALVPELIADLRAAIVKAGEAEPVALVLSGRGHSFSTGGDISGFLAHAGSLKELRTYAEELVGGLHDAILDLLAFPAPVLAAVNGPVTGGSTGLMLAADMVAMSERAFVQPYYCEVGFAPDGGWTALLPDRIGTAAALRIQYLNERIGAEKARALGIADSVRPLSQLEAEIDAWTSAIGQGFGQTHKATRANVWDAERLGAVRHRLDREKDRFLDLVARPETLSGMKDFGKKRA